MSLQLDSMLDAEQERQLQSHLNQCPGCREQWETMSWLSSMLAAEPVATPVPDFTGKVLARLEKRAARRQRLYSTIAVCVVSVALWTAAAAVVLVMATALTDPSTHSVLTDIMLSLGRNILAFLTVLGKALWSVARAVVTRPAGLLVLGYVLVALALTTLWTRSVFRRWGRVEE